MIRKLRIEDAPAMYEWMHDETVVRNLQADFMSFGMDKVNSFIRANSEPDMDGDNVNYAICDEEDNYVGTISLKNIDRKNKNAEYAIVTGSKAHGKGYAKLATMDILKVAFEKLELERVYLYVSIDNIPANKFYQKMHFVEEGVFRKHLMIDGELRDIRWYSILHEDYLRMKEENER